MSLQISMAVLGKIGELVVNMKSTRDPVAIEKTVGEHIHIAEGMTGLR